MFLLRLFTRVICLVLYVVFCCVWTPGSAAAILEAKEDPKKEEKIKNTAARKLIMENNGKKCDIILNKPNCPCWFSII